MTFIKSLILILSISGLTATGFARTHILKNSLVTSNNTVSLDQLFVNSPELKNYSIFIDKSKYFNNENVSRLLWENGEKDAVILGQGIEIISRTQMDNMDILKDRLTALYPMLMIDWDGIELPYTGFIIDDFKVIQNPGHLQVALNLTIFEDNIPQDKNIALKLSYSNKTVVKSEQEAVYLEDVEGHVAHVVYRKGGLILHLKADIIQDLGQGYYQVKSPLNGKLLKVRLNHTKETP